MSEAPHRKIEIELKLSADTWRDVQAAFNILERTDVMDIEKIKAREINALIDKLMQWNAFHDMPGENCRLSSDEVGTAIVALEKHVAALSPALEKEGVGWASEAQKCLPAMYQYMEGYTVEDTGLIPMTFSFREWRTIIDAILAVSVQEQKT